MTQFDGDDLVKTLKSLIDDGALDKVEQAISGYGDQAEGYFLCAGIYFDKGWGNQGIQCLKKAHALRPRSLEYLGKLAEKLFEAGDFDDAIAHYSRVLEIQSVAWAYIGLGNIYEKKGDIDQCIQCFQKAVAYNKAHSLPSVDLLTRLVKLQRLRVDTEGLMQSLRDLVAEDCSAAVKYDSLCGLARAHHLLGNHQEAIELYMKALGIADENDTAYIGLADIYQALGQTKEEIDVLQRVCKTSESYELKQRLLRLLQKDAADQSSPPDEPSNQSHIMSDAELSQHNELVDCEKDELIQADYAKMDLSRLVSHVLRSGLFNYLHYRQQAGCEFTLSGAIEHFLCSGAEQGLTAMPHFDFESYRLINSDVSSLTNAQCFVHYLLKGRTEKRYYNRAILRRDAAELRLSPWFDSAWYASLISGPSHGLSCHEHYLAIGWRHNLPPNRQGFGSQLYLDFYEDARNSSLPPFLHWLKNEQARSFSQAGINHLVHVIHMSDEFDSVFYRLQCKEPIPGRLSDILHYVCYGVGLKLDPNANFSTEYYLRKYQDIRASGMNPFVHYLANGRSEGRLGNFNARIHIGSGRCAFDPGKPTIIIVCHEASRTGAPILGLRLVEQLAQRANIISWNGKHGPLTDDFAESSVAVINHFFDPIDSVWLIRELKKLFDPQAAIVNSVVTSCVAVALHEEQVPVVALVHEYGDYTNAQELQMFLCANSVVFPAESVKASVDRALVDAVGVPRTKGVFVRHQGRCIPPANKEGEGVAIGKEQILSKLGVSEDDEKPVIVLGCGWVQIRKGLEYFIDAARICKRRLNRPLRFIWVGGGYRPDVDVGYSVWLKSQVLNAELGDEVVFFDETPDLTPFFELADVFFLSSRLDPFPNVAIDAVDAGVPIVAFERGTGFAEFINANPGIGVVVPFLDTQAAAEAICQFATKTQRNVDYPAIQKQLSFQDYTDFVWTRCQAAITEQQQVVAESQLLVDTKFMDVDFFKSSYHPFWNNELTPEYLYVSRLAKGFAFAKARVGFNEQVAQSVLAQEISSTHSITALAAALKSLASPLTHKVFYVDANRPHNASQSHAAVAVHIHAYNIDKLSSLLQRLTAVSTMANVYITTDTDEKANEIVRISKKHPLNVNVEIVPNRGRDVGPFLMLMKDKLSAFDIVGHFHLKATKELQAAVVSQWQNFLHDTLLGKNGEIADHLLGLFDVHPKLGFLFQEDPSLSGWCKNYPFAKNLMAKLGFDRRLPEHIEYPTGNMFWARTAALAPLMRCDWQWRDFPAEPVPYDGSILHAIERLTPLICEEAGYEWATVHIPQAKRYSI